MMNLIQSPWTAVAVGTLIYWTTTYALFARQHFTQPAQPGVQAGEAFPVFSGPSWDFRNPELDLLVSELKGQRESLRQREQQLNELQARLAAERKEITTVTQTVWQLRIELDRVGFRISAEEAANLKKLAKMYGAMTPDGAARILRELDETQAAKILALMKEAESALILENLSKDGAASARQAAELADRLRLFSTATNQIPTQKAL
ncbi:MAG: MotE family protein [Limisphaerales bacterium]